MRLPSSSSIPYETLLANSKASNTPVGVRYSLHSSLHSSLHVPPFEPLFSVLFAWSLQESLISIDLMGREAWPTGRGCGSSADLHRYCMEPRSKGVEGEAE